MESNKLGKTLCYILRHAPDKFSLTMDDYGYIDIDKLIIQLNKIGFSVNRESIFNEVKNDTKGRYVIKDNMIKCQFGHSIHIKLEKYDETVPDVLFHGTSITNVESILREGLFPRARRYVHLTSDKSVATQVGLRHAKTKENLVILVVDSKKMKEDEIKIHPSNSTTYLTDHVDKKYIKYE